MFNELESKDFFSIFYFKKIVGEEEFAVFTDALTAYKAHLQSNANQNEDSIVANALKPFFMALGFSADIKHKQKGNSEIDLVLKKDSAVTTIIEAKKPNSTEMFSPSNPHAKALCEAILYYFREREGGNLSIQSLIITDFYRFYIFKAQDFERTFYKNPALKNLYDRFSAPNSLFKGNTEEFYSESKRILETSDFSMGYFCFDLGRIFNEDLSFATLKPIFKALHKDFLFGEFNPNDANILNEKFYRELLYILGLSEVDEKGKILIKPSKESKNGANTLYNEILANLPKESADFESAMQFIVLWLNRILFLKLIEANLVRFNDDKNLKFLNLFKVPDFQVMSHLFFKILAKKHNEREISDSPLAYLPHLNSSLFEKHECEELLDISAIDNNAKLKYFATTQIKDKSGKTNSGSVVLLAYIFEFLDAFDFGSDESSGEIAMQKELISSSVLGLVFEKLNGYKEGSFFTPSFITSYMCRVSLEKVVLEKFGELGLNAVDLDSLKSQILMNTNADFSFKQKALGALQSIRICDPAVGSGHFLVSALCEMIGIYHKLGLIDELSEYKLQIDSDEIIIHITDDRIFEYKKPTKPNDANQAIQKALFGLKKSIIENNLFGVDINPNSVEICKLRLWIELLKNSYYLRDSSEGFDKNLSDSIHQMQTLPNIDINIKCGNSLISRFDLCDSLNHIPNIANRIAEYKKLVFDYKNADQAILKVHKSDIEAKIAHIKKSFNLVLKDPKTKIALEKAIEKHTAHYGFYLLDDESILAGLNGGFHKLFDNEMSLNEKEQESALESYANIMKLRKKLDSELSGEEYEGAFEWRFEFPEVLDKNGDFMGFDLIIGNPPYGNLNKIETKQYIESKYSNSYFGEISSNFAELAHNLIKQKAHFSFVTSYALLFSLAQSRLRNLLHSNYKHIQISSYDRDGAPQFDKMSQSVCILFADSKNANQKAIFRTSNFVRQKIAHEELEFSEIDDLLLIGDELGNDFTQRHRIPKIGGATNLKLLKQLKNLPNKLGNLFGGNESLYIRTSGNYWYNAFLEIPYKSTEIKQFGVSNKYFMFCLINSNIYYWWLRIYGDGRHNNRDIMNSFRLPNVDLIKKHNDLWQKLALNHWDKMKSVFNTQHNFFATSQIKDSVDILDYHICLKVLGFDMKTLKYICDYDSNIRGGLKCDFRKLGK